MNKNKLIAIQRIQKDIKEILENPMEGIALIQLNKNDIMQYIVNIKLMCGIYEGYCLQLLLIFNQYYPVKPPRILIFPGQEFDGRFHKHIFNEYEKINGENHYKKFCFDLLENSLMNTNEEYSGWNPSYNISSILLQVQNFLANMHDFNTRPPKQKIDFLLNSMNNYQRDFIDLNGNIITHTWENPYPSFPKISKNNNNNKEENSEEIKKLNEIKENLTCFMLKLNYIDDKDIILGYPIIQKKIMQRNPKIELYPIPELLTYDGYMSQIARQNEKLDYYFDTNFKSANNEFYNYWIPIYVDKNHYEKNKTTILNSFSIIKYGPLGIKQYDFKPEQIFEILPIILNKMIIGIFNNRNKMSQNFIRCYFHYILLFKKLIENYKKDFNNYIKYYFDSIINNNFQFNKNLIPDIGNFMMLLFFSDLVIPQKLWDCLFVEYLIRQMYWLFHSEETKEKVQEILFDKNSICLRLFKIDPNFKMKYQQNFIQDCQFKEIINYIINEMTKDREIILEYNNSQENNSIQNYIYNSITRNFKKIYNLCEENTQQKINDIILKTLNFKNYFLVNFQNNDFYRLYDSFRIKEILQKLKESNDNATKKKFIQYAFSSQRGNPLLLVSFIAKNKIQENGFLEELEKNYGVLLDADNLMKEIKQRLNEIKCFSQLYKYIGCDLLKSNDINNEIELISYAYVKAKYKRYINIKSLDNNKQYNSFNFWNSN